MSLSDLDCFHFEIGAACDNLEKMTSILNEMEKRSVQDYTTNNDDKYRGKIKKFHRHFFLLGQKLDIARLDIRCKTNV